MQQHMHTQSFTKEQKVGFLLLFVFAIFAVGLGALQIRNTIYAPFAFDDTPESPLANVVSTEEQQTLRLKSIDTDNDGLYDYDEIYLYETSPYIEDTDSDGISDAREIETSTDPLCPKDKKCDRQDPVTSPTSDQTVTQDPTQQRLQGFLGNNTVMVPKEQQASADQQVFEKLINDPTYLRNILIETGEVSYDKLSEISDEDLVASVKEAMQQQVQKEQSSGIEEAQGTPLDVLEKTLF
ncbi:MAG: hypothetical protein HOJ25_01435 [Candidatus Magasanikbacteria bacterium]|jgi:hypothetical protein|nr:hypothetical protein [Candidatus Magasanikbacteria bacterium]MBT5820658.1 hypothetical protein [Candidatus Magasanikbacteria bacterium]MBT6294332.1 hypothetical protein [Candidatus Magasanikbacteria bacterium]